MIRSYLVVFVASAVLGLLSGYMITTMLRDNMQAELKYLAQHLASSTRDATHVSKLEAGSESGNYLTNSEQRQQFLTEIARVVEQAVSVSLRQHASQQQQREAQLVTLEQSKAENAAAQTESRSYQYSEAIRTRIGMANEVLSAAIARGYWDENDAQAYRDALQKVPADVQSKAYQRLSVAINKGEVQLRGDAPM